MTFSKDTIMNVKAPHENQMKIINEKDITIEGYQKLKKKFLDLDKLTFQDGNHQMSNKKVKLPKNSKQINKKGYTEVIVPPSVRKKKKIKLIPISDLPRWA